MSDDSGTVCVMVDPVALSPIGSRLFLHGYKGNDNVSIDKTRAKILSSNIVIKGKDEAQFLLCNCSSTVLELVEPMAKRKHVICLQRMHEYHIFSTEERSCCWFSNEQNAMVWEG